MNRDVPRPSPALVVATEALLGIMFLVGVGAIVFLPGLSADLATSFPEYASLRAPLLVIAITFAVLGLIAVTMVALLVLRISNGTVLARRSLVWVDVLIVSIGCAVALIAVGFVAVSNGQAGSPAVAFTQALTSLTLIAVACITLVLRSLLRDAMTMRAELDGVV